MSEATRGPDRQALASAITAHNRPRSAWSELARRPPRAGDLWHEALRAEERAEAQLAAMRGSEGRLLADALLAEREPGVSPVKAAARLDVDHAGVARDDAADGRERQVLGSGSDRIKRAVKARLKTRTASCAAATTRS